MGLFTKFAVFFEKTANSCISKPKNKKSNTIYHFINSLNIGFKKLPTIFFHWYCINVARICTRLTKNQ